MRASNSYLSSGSQITKIAIVTALHLAFALALINMKTLIPSSPPLVVKPISPPRTVVVTPPIVEADTTTKQIVPVLFVPKTEVKVQPEPTPDTPVAKTLPPGPRPIDGAGGVDKNNPGNALRRSNGPDVQQPRARRFPLESQRRLTAEYLPNRRYLLWVKRPKVEQHPLPAQQSSVVVEIEVCGPLIADSQGE